MKFYSLEIPEKIFGIESVLAIMFLPVVALVVLIIVSVNLIIVPKFEEYNEMSTKLASLENQTVKTNEKIKYLQSVDTDDLKRDSEAISSALLPQNNSYLLVGVVRKIADKYGFQIDSFVISPGKLGEAPKIGKDGVLKIPVTLSLVGPTTRYLELIKGLERSLPVLSLDTFDMKNDNEVSRLDLKISAFYTENKNKIDINKLTLSELTLKKEESELLAKIGEYTIWEDVGSRIQEGSGVEFREYDRTDPFSL